MGTFQAVSDSEDTGCIIVELRGGLTETALADLYVLVPSDGSEVVAWWESHRGGWLGPAFVGKA